MVEFLMEGFVTGLRQMHEFSVVLFISRACTYQIKAVNHLLIHDIFKEENSRYTGKM